MRRVAGDRLEHLGHDAVGIAREEMPYRQRFELGGLEFLHADAQRRPFVQNDGSRIGRQTALADDAADRPLASDHGRLDRAPVLQHDLEGEQRGVEGKVDVPNVVARLIEHLVLVQAHRLEVRPQKRPVRRLHREQQIVLQGVACLGKRCQ